MKKTIVLFVLSVVLPIMVLASGHKGSVMIKDAWIPEAPANAPSLAGYMVVENHGKAPRKLVGASCSAFSMVMLHSTEHKDGMARMVHHDSIAIPGNGKLAFEPGGYHLMLMGAKKPLKAGDRVVVELKVDDGSKISVEFEVRKGMPGMGMDEHAGHDMKHMNH